MTSAPQYAPTLSLELAAPVAGYTPAITWKAFKTKYLSREDGYKYEWLNGVVEKSKCDMDFRQLYIFRTLSNRFYQCTSNIPNRGMLIRKPDLFFLENHRRPDVCWLTETQIAGLTYESTDVPAFVIEVISNNDQMNKVHKKMEDYERAGVQVVWHIFPLLGKIDVYSGTRLSTMQVCREDDICSAAPALPEFRLSVSDILKKPAQPV
jgi:Uma2 family endonuclease